MRERIEISKQDLTRLYYGERKSKYKIGAVYDCSFKTVLNRMREYGMKPLSRSIIQSRYEKNDFSGIKTEKAYLIGFRLGDLNVYKTVPHSEVVIARTNTTHTEQLKLLKKLFDKYGRVSATQNRKLKSININCFLNNTFDFLLPKTDYVENWISQNLEYSRAFAAGYVDAEANVGVYDGRARFKIDSYDKGILKWFYDWFRNNNITCPFPKEIAFGKIYGTKYNKPLWRIRVSESSSLVLLYKSLRPFLRHEKRIRDFNLCINNIYDRRNNK